MVETNNYNFHNILKLSISSNTKRNLKYFDNKLWFFRTKESIKPDIEVFVRKFKFPIKAQCSTQQKFCVYKNIIYWEDSHKLGKWRVALKNLDRDKVAVFFNGNFFSYKYLFMHILEPLLYYKLHSKGFLLLHSSCVSNGENAYVFTSLPGTGKTSLMLYLLNQGMVEYFSDEFTIISKNGFAYSYPTPIDIFFYNLKNNTFLKQKLGYRIKLNIARNFVIYFLSLKYAKPSSSIDIKEIFPKIDIGQKRSIASIFILRTTNKEKFIVKENIKKEEMVQKIIQINKLQFKSFLDCINALSPYKFESTKLTYQYDFKEVVFDILNKVPCHEIQIPKNYNFKDDLFFLSIKKVMQKYKK